MRSLTAAPAAVADALGREPGRALLLSQLALEGPGWSGPFLLEEDGRRTLLCRDIERGNVEALRPPTPVAYHTPYFLMVPPEGLAIAPDLRAAVAEHGSGGRVAADPSLPYGRLLELGELASQPPAPAAERVVVRRIDRARAIAAFGRHAHVAVTVARDAISQRPGLPEALGSIEPLPDTRFERLDQLLQAAGATAVLACSSINAGELSGEATEPDALVLACRDDTGVYVIEPATSARRHGEEATEFPSPAAAVKALVGGTAALAIEERALSAGEAIALREHGFRLLPFTVPLSRWR